MARQWYDVSVTRGMSSMHCCRETRDPRVEPTLRALTAFFEGQDVLYAGYTLAGKSLVRYSHLGFTAPVHCLFKVRTQWSL